MEQGPRVLQSQDLQSRVLESEVQLGQAEIEKSQAPQAKAARAESGEGLHAEPRLLVQLEAWHRVFSRNFRDLFSRRQPPLRLASKPGEFWADVFVSSRLPWRGFAESVSGQAALIAAVWSLAQIWPHPRPIALQPAFHHEDVVYYEPSEYLAPLNTGQAPAARPRKGDPAYAAQPIISVPAEADNHTQTIVTPPEAKLDKDAPLPNIVAWSKAPVQMPLAATEHSLADAKTAVFDVPVIAPPPEVQRTDTRQSPTLQQQAVAPAPEVSAASSRSALASPQVSVIEPPPEVKNSSTRRLGDLNIGHAAVVAPAPALPLYEQRALAGMKQGTLGGGAGAAVPPPPSLQGAGSSRSGGRLIALGIHPTAPGGPVDVPAGNRRGSFAATPQGRAGAAGTPDVTGDAQSSQSGPGGKSREGAAGAGAGKSASGVPSGLFVGAGPDSANHSSAAGNGSGSGAGGDASHASSTTVLTAKAAPPRVSSAPHHSPNEVSPSNVSEEEKQVFGDRKSYAMSVNMPNFNSAGGSWVIHFAELNESDSDRGSKNDLVAPTVTAIADPAYPLELMHRNVQGTVMLRAVIGSDGSVSDVRVLRSVDDRLDEYAREALLHWHFHPAMRNGTAVALEAVVRIPFRSNRVRSSF